MERVKMQVSGIDNAMKAQESARKELVILANIL